MNTAIIKDLSNPDSPVIEADLPVNMDIWVDDHRKITISVNEHGVSVEMPYGEDRVKVHRTKGSFFARYSPIDNFRDAHKE